MLVFFMFYKDSRHLHELNITAIFNVMSLFTVMIMYGKQRPERVIVSVHRNTLKHSLFSCQDPCWPSHDRDDFPNWKVRPLLQWINFALVLLFGVWVGIFLLMRWQYGARDLIVIYYVSPTRMKAMVFKVMMHCAKKDFVLLLSTLHGEWTTTRQVY